jgi:hypothetical protein
MLAASHALIGASLAQLIPNPYLGYPLAIGIHFLMDIFPHWDFRTRKTSRSKKMTVLISLTDAAIGFSLGWLIFNQQIDFIYLFSMMFISQLPDWLEAPYIIFDWHFPPFSTIKQIQGRLHYKLNLPWGLIWQILTVALIIFLAKL